MKASSDEVVSRLRDTKARNLTFDEYERELTMLATEQFGERDFAPSGNRGVGRQFDIIQSRRLVELERRIGVLEQRVRKLEARK